MAQSSNTLAIKLDAGPDAQIPEVDQLTRALRHALLDTDAEAVDLAGEDALPEGAKGFGLVAVGALLVKLGPGALAAVVKVVQQFVSRADHRKAKLELAGESIELSGISSGQQQQLIDAWVAAVSQKLDGR